MKCDEVRAELISYLESGLKGKIRERVERHLKECSDCRQHLELFLKTSNLVSKMLHSKSEKISLPTMLWSKIITRVQMDRKNHQLLRPWLKVAIGLVASLTVVLVGTFAPVFGSEGNLLNVITSHIVNNAGNDLGLIFTPDLKGEVIKTATIKQLSDQSGLTDVDIWRLKDSGFKPLDIVKTSIIVSRSNMTLDEVIDLRQMNYGWGRIINLSGISVFNALDEVANPILQAKKDFEYKQEFTFTSDMAKLDGKLIISDLATLVDISPILEPTDDNGKKIAWEDIPDNNPVNLTFRFVDGEIKPVSINVPVKETPPDPIRFRIEGKITNFVDKTVTLDVDGQTFKVSIVPGETNIKADLIEGQHVIMFGFKIGLKNIAKLIRKGFQNGLKLGKSKGHNKVEGSIKPEPKLEPKTTDTPSVNQNEKKPDNSNLIKSEKPFTSKIATLLTLKENVLKTDIGNFKLDIETIGINGQNYSFTTDIINILPLGTRLILSGHDDIVTTVKITSDSVSMRSGYIVKIEPRIQNFILMLRPGSFEAISIGSYTKFIDKLGKLSSNAQINLEPGKHVTVITTPDLKTLYIQQLNTLGPQKYPGRVKNITETQIELDSKTFKITRYTMWLRMTRQAESSFETILPSDIKPGDSVMVQAFTHESNFYAVKIIKTPGSGVGPGNPPPGSRKGQEARTVRYLSIVEGSENIEVGLTDGLAIVIKPGYTKVFFEERPGKQRVADLKEVKNGVSITFKTDDQGFAQEVIILP